MSVIAAAFALDTKSGRTRFPRFNRIDVGSIKRISLANVLRRIDGFREVVTMGRGSINPDVRAYSSSMSKRSASLFFCADAGNDSSYFKIFAELLIVCDGWVQWLSGGQRSLQLRTLFGDRGIAEKQSSPIQIISSFTGLTALLGC